MALNESINRTIRNRLNRLGEQMRSVIMQQIPQPGKNPFATGALQKSFTIRAQKRGDTWSLLMGYTQYGIYTNLGSGVYRSPDASPFNLPPYLGYSKGLGGIKPQYWLSIPGSDVMLEEFRQLIKSDYNKEIETQFKSRWNFT